jgi:ribose 5-phosphate isomerase
VDDYVKSGMVVGLGTGSTAAFAGTCAIVIDVLHAYIWIHMP